MTHGLPLGWTELKRRPRPEVPPRPTPEPLIELRPPMGYHRAGRNLRSNGRLDARREREHLARVEMENEVIRARNQHAEQAWSLEHDRVQAQQAAWSREPDVGLVRSAVDRSRLDVVGGSPYSWSALLVTMLTPGLLAGRDCIVIDLTWDAVARELLTIAEAAYVTTGGCSLRVDASQFDLLAGAGPVEAVDALTSALYDIEEGGSGVAESQRLRASRQVLLAVCTSLNSLGIGISTSSIAGALDLLLNGVDMSNVKSQIHSVPLLRSLQSDQLLSSQVRYAKESLADLRSSVALAAEALVLDGDDSGVAQAEPVFECHDGLQVYSTENCTSDLAEVAGPFMCTRVTQMLERGGFPAGSGCDVVIAGAERLPEVSLRRLIDATAKMRASRVDINLVCLFRDFSGAADSLVGRSGADVLLMRQMTRQDAETASKHIGDRVSYVLQSTADGLSRTVGGSSGSSSTFTSGTNTGVSDSRSYGFMAPNQNSLSTSQSTNSGTSSQTSWSSTWQDATTTTGTTGRVREAEVGPELFLELGDTQFIYRSHSDESGLPNGPRRALDDSQRKYVIWGDCNPFLHRQRTADSWLPETAIDPLDSRLPAQVRGPVRITDETDSTPPGSNAPMLER